MTEEERAAKALGVIVIGTRFVAPNPYNIIGGKIAVHGFASLTYIYTKDGWTNADGGRILTTLAQEYLTDKYLGRDRPR